METLKIALVSDWFKPNSGGIESHMNDLARELSKRGHEVHVITKFSRIEKNDEFSIHMFRGKISLKKFNISIGTGMLKRIDQLYRRENFDLTHAHSIFSPLALSVSVLSSGIRNIPTVITSHSLIGKTVLNPIYVSFLRNALKKVDSFIAVSSVVKNDLEKILGKSREGRKIFIIPNAIDTDFWKPDKSVKKEDKILTVSRFTKRKRICVIPKIAKNVLEKIDVEFIIIGDGPEKEKLKLLIEKYKLKNKVRIVGKMKRENLINYYRSSSLYLSPAIYEAFSISVLEALSTNTPVLGRKESGISDIVKDGVNGFLFTSDLQYSKTILRLFENKKELKKISSTYKFVRKNYSWKKVIKEIEKAYKHTIEYHKDNRFWMYKMYKNIRKGD